MANSDNLMRPIKLGAIELKNRFVMAPMTRSRAEDDDTVSDLHVRYYAQRASAGLIITEGVQPSVNGKGYCRTPGIYNAEQISAWRVVTDAVHAKGGTIVCQIMHCGRVGHADNKRPDAENVSPSAIDCDEEIFTEKGMQRMSKTRALTLDEIPLVIEEYRQATVNALEAGFDGVELHCTSGYLPAQFLSTGTNQRDDQYGGSLENRLRFVLQTLKAMVSAAGGERVGMRICPGNSFNGLQDENPSETFATLLQRVNAFNLAYLHVIRMPQTGIDNIALAKENFSGPLIVNESFEIDEANRIIEQEKSVEAVSFGRLFIANPDLVARIQSGAELNAIDFKTLYSPGAKGYTDYPSL